MLNLSFALLARYRVVAVIDLQAPPKLRCLGRSSNNLFGFYATSSFQVSAAPLQQPGQIKNVSPNWPALFFSLLFYVLYILVFINVQLLWLVFIFMLTLASHRLLFKTCASRCPLTKKKESIPFLILCKVKELTYTVALIKGRDKNLPPPHRLRLRRLNTGGTNRSKSLAALPKGPKGGVYYNNIQRLASVKVRLVFSGYYD